LSQKREKGTKPLILGTVLILLALFNIIMSKIANTSIDPFYFVITAAGAATIVFGAWQRKKIEKE
jgi:hypothetical protein